MESSKPIVLITGATGYVGSWTVAKILGEGKYRVRGTARNISNEEKLEPFRKALKEHCPSNYDEFELVEASLEDPDSIARAVDGVTCVLHIASPMPGPNIKNQEKQMIQPAIDGNLNVLKACVGSSVKRVVITSSGLTMWDHKKGPGVYSYDSIIEESPKLDGYSKSKIRAENAAREYAKELDDKNERTFDILFLNPGGISGAPLVPLFKGEGIKMFAMFLNGKFPSVPIVYYPLVDVQDVAQAHVNAIEKGKHLGRYPINSDTLRMVEITQIIKDKYEPMGFKVGNKELPKCLVWMMSFCNSDARNIYYHWDIKAELDGEYGAKELGLPKYIPCDESIYSTCDFLIENEFVKPKKKK